MCSELSECVLPCPSLKVCNDVPGSWKTLEASSLSMENFFYHFSSYIKRNMRDLSKCLFIKVDYPCVHLFVRAEVTGWHQVFFWIILHFIFEDSLLLNLELTNLTRLAHQRVPRTLLLVLPSNESAGVYHHVQPWGECWIWTQSSRWHNKHFTDWAKSSTSSQISRYLEWSCKTFP